MASTDGPGRSAGREAGLSVIAAGTTITGELTSDGVVKIEGTVVGSVRADRQVLVAKGGVIEGDVYTKEAVVGGEVRGAILADDRVEVQASSVIQGDITTQRIVVHEGGEVNGHVRMSNPQALVQAPAPTQPAPREERTQELAHQAP
ncbi:MAG: polymer-forming cytoskeletal protein [Gemmatimonadetes bacterium]|nr:polymer-forming cytoskeletal protein [Gemmatimonadota bacterium]